MNSERWLVAWVEGQGYGIIRETHTHYAMIEFSSRGHSWLLAVDHDDYEIIEHISVGYEEIE